MADSVIRVEPITHEINKRVSGANPERVDTYYSGRWATVYFEVYQAFTANTWLNIGLQKNLQAPKTDVAVENACVSQNGERCGIVQIADNGGTYTLRFLFNETFTGYARGSITYPI